MADKKRLIYSVTLSNEAKLEMLRTVLAYEGAARGLGAGQTLFELVLEAADPERYPEELRKRLAEFEDGRLEEVEEYLSRYMRAERSA